MHFQKEVKLLVLPLLKSAPVILILVVLALLGMKRAVTLMTPTYRASGAIKINNLEYSQSGFLLFGKDEGVRHQQNQTFLTELEIFRSRDLIKSALQELNWEHSIYRVGRFREAELGVESPFLLEVDSTTDTKESISLIYRGEGNFRAQLAPAGDTLEVVWGKQYTLGSWQFTLQPREDFIAHNPASLRAGDQFRLRSQSLDKLVSGVNESNLFVKAVEKDVSIIKIYFKHERPEKAQAFVDQLMISYIDECRRAKAEQTDTTLLYLDQQLSGVARKLTSAEAQLARFRTQSGTVDTKLETDAQLRGISQLDQQKMDIQLRKGELEKLYQYLLGGQNLVDFSPNLEALQDAVFRESFLQMQQFEIQKQDLLQRYVPSSEEVQHVVLKINKLRTFLNESVRNTLDKLDYQLEELKVAVDDASAELHELPEREQTLIQLQRNVSLNEAMYNYLVRKRTELSIHRSSNLYPHKIIDHARLPETLAAPNKPLLYGLAILLALMAGMTFAYMRHYFSARVRYAEDLEEKLEVPVLANVYRQAKRSYLPWRRQHVATGFELCSNLMANLNHYGLQKEQQPQLLVMTSMTPGEGKSFVSFHLAKSMADSGHKVLLVDADLRNPSLHQKVGRNSSPGLAEALRGEIAAIQTTENSNLDFLAAGQSDLSTLAGCFGPGFSTMVEALRASYDYIIVDTPPIGLFQEQSPWIETADLNLFILRADYTRTRLLRAIKKQLVELDGTPLRLVLNDTLRSRTLPGYRRMLKTYYQS